MFSLIPSQGRGILGEVGRENLRLAASPRPGEACSLEGTVGEDRVELSIVPEEGGVNIHGFCPGGQVELTRRMQGNSADPIVSGRVGGRPVELALRSWSRSEATVSGYVGNERVEVTQRRQLDGHVLTGYLGTQRFNLREREMPGQGLDLEPIEYLATLVRPQENFIRATATARA